MKSFSFATLLSLVAHSFATPVYTPTDAADLVRRDGTGSVTGSAGLSWYDPQIVDGGKGRSNTSAYVCYKGAATNFPARTTWMNFKAMFALQKQVNLQYVDNANQIQYIYNSILNISQLAKVDARVILGVIIEESSGNVTVPCTTSYGGVQNCGLMQSYNPTQKSFDRAHPAVSINQMIQDGTQGTAAGPGLVQWFNHASDVSFDTAGNVYKVLRGYNSGAINMTDLSDGKGANAAYVSHIANYMQGWDGSNAAAAVKSCSFYTAKTTTTKPTPTPTPSKCVASAYAPAPTQTVSGTTKNCCKWAVVQSGNTCDTIDKAAGITLNQLRSWNTYINSDCTNLFANYAYCVSSNDPITVSAAGAVKAAPTSAASSAVKASSGAVKASSSAPKTSAKSSGAKPTPTSK